MSCKLITASIFAAVSLALIPSEAAACPICFGIDPGSKLGQGMNWAVFALLGITGGVLSGFIGFIYHLVKRSQQALNQQRGDR
tara:strand:- start:513 stop:761 length:249 start_codon:yes stop_codon:yes gene_type:complete